MAVDHKQQVILLTLRRQHVNLGLLLGYGETAGDSSRAVDLENIEHELIQPVCGSPYNYT